MSTSNWSFTEGTVGRIGEQKVTFSNIMLQDYTLADGTIKEGLATSLFIPGTPREIVGVGHVFTVNGVKYEVVSVEDGSPFGKVVVKVHEPTWSFTEGTVGRIGEQKVTFSNIMLQDYTLANGTTKEGLATSLFIPGTPREIVGVGHVFTVDGVKYEIVSVEDGSPFGKVVVKVHEPTWSFTEGTVGRIGEQKVTFSNIMLQDYTLANGTTKEGLATSLFIPGTPREIVGVGHVFTVDGVKYEVVSVEDGSPFGKVEVIEHNN